MATRRKNWFKVADSILREDWDDVQLASVVRLMAWLNQRWARDGIDHELAGEAFLDPADACKVFGVRSWRACRARVARVSCALGARDALVPSARGVTVSWAKFAEFQDFGPRSPGSDCPVESPSFSKTSPSPSKTPPTPPTEQPDPPVSVGADPAASAAVCGGKDPPKQSKPKKPKKPKAPQLPFPARGSPAEAAVRAVFANARPADADYALEHFRDWAEGKAEHKARWPAAARSAVRTGWVWPRDPPGNGGNGRPDTGNGSMRRKLEQAAEAVERRLHGPQTQDAFAAARDVSGAKLRLGDDSGDLPRRLQ